MRKKRKKENYNNNLELISVLMFIILPPIISIPLHFNCKLYFKILAGIYIGTFSLYAIAVASFFTSENFCKTFESNLLFLALLSFFIVLPLISTIFSFLCNVFWGIISLLLYAIAYIILFLKS